MAKYKCQNPDCNHVWDAEEEPFECPACQGLDFLKIGGKTKWLKWLAIAAGALILLMILIKVIDDSDKTTITTKADSDRCTLAVKIAGKHSKEYDIILRKDGVIHGSAAKKETKVFDNLEGTYTLDVKFRGTGKMPKVNPYKKTYTFVKPAAAPEAPQIIVLRPNPPKLTNPGQTYMVTVVTDTTIVPLKETEFSIDGTNWQRAAGFKGLKAGTYTFMVRNARDKNLQDAATLVLPPYEPKPLPTIDDLNRRLRGIADKSRRQEDRDKDYDSLCGVKVEKVKGVDKVGSVEELANEAEQGRLFQVTAMDTANGVIKSITVKKIK